MSRGRSAGEASHATVRDTDRTAVGGRLSALMPTLVDDLTRPPAFTSVYYPFRMRTGG